MLSSLQGVVYKTKYSKFMAIKPRTPKRTWCYNHPPVSFYWWALKFFNPSIKFFQMISTVSNNTYVSYMISYIKYVCYIMLHNLCNLHMFLVTNNWYEMCWLNSRKSDGFCKKGWMVLNWEGGGGIAAFLSANQRAPFKSLSIFRSVQLLGYLKTPDLEI